MAISEDGHLSKMVGALRMPRARRVDAALNRG